MTNRFTAWAIALAAFAILFPVLATPVRAGHSQCAQRSTIVASLTTDYFESLKATGTIGDKLIMEIYVAESGSWTILTTTSDGCSRVVAAGQSWSDISLEPLLPGMDS